MTCGFHTYPLSPLVLKVLELLVTFISLSLLFFILPSPPPLRPQLPLGAKLSVMSVLLLTRAKLQNIISWSMILRFYVCAHICYWR